MLLSHLNITTDHLHSDLLREKQLQLSVLRLDKLHPIISGNKLFKLRHFLDQLIAGNTVITFGGAYSNHLVATAYACKTMQLRSIGIVRGEKPPVLSNTLLDCIRYGMELLFISRAEYDNKNQVDFLQRLILPYPDAVIIPAGGYSPTGATGAAGILQYIDQQYTHIACAVGTATTLAGLLQNIRPHQKLIGIPVLKGMADIPERLQFLNVSSHALDQLQLFDAYHFGGYAKKNDTLISFMNSLFAVHALPTDFVYTAKLMYGIMDLIRHDFFKPGSKIMCLHTGGLQGNLSLQKGILTFK